VEENKSFSIKIKTISPGQALGPGGWFRYEVLSKKPAGNWEEVFVEEHDDRFEPNSDNILILSSSEAFIFVINKYAVTIDQGQTWETFNLDDLGSLSEPSCGIDQVLLRKDGSGEMRLKCSGSRLITKNFGRSWKRQKGSF